MFKDKTFYSSVVRWYDEKLTSKSHKPNPCRVAIDYLNGLISTAWVNKYLYGRKNAISSGKCFIRYLFRELAFSIAGVSSSFSVSYLDI